MHLAQREDDAMSSIDAVLEWLDREIDDAERELGILRSAFAGLPADDGRRADVPSFDWLLAIPSGRQRTASSD